MENKQYSPELQRAGMNSNPLQIAKYIVQGREKSCLLRAQQLRLELNKLIRTIEQEKSNPNRKCSLDTLKKLTDLFISQKNTPSPSKPTTIDRDAQGEKAQKANKTDEL